MTLYCTIGEAAWRFDLACAVTIGCVVVLILAAHDWLAIGGKHA